MLYRYFIGTGETDIESVEQVYMLYKKGMINSTSKLYDVENNVYVAVSEIPGFNDVFRGNYSKEGKSTKILRYIVSSVFFLLFLLIGMVNTFLNLGLEKMENSTTYFLGYLIATFFVISALIALVIVICIKAGKKYSSILIVSSSILMFVISIFFLVNTVGTINAVKAKQVQKEKVALEKIITLYRMVSSGEVLEREYISSDEYGEFAPLVSETQNYVLLLTPVNMGVSYLYKNISINQIVPPEAVADVERIRKNRESIKVVLSGLSESKMEAVAIHDTYISKIEKLVIPKSVKEEFIVGTKEICEIEKKETEELYDFNINLFQKIDELLKYFEDRAGKYKVEDNRILFNEKPDDDNYKKLIEEYNNILEEYNKAVESKLKNAGNKLDFLDDLVHRIY